MTDEEGKETSSGFEYEENAFGKEEPEKVHVFQTLQTLRKICNHPGLVIKESFPNINKILNKMGISSIDDEKLKGLLEDINASSKLNALRQLLVDCNIGNNEENPLLSFSSSSVGSIKQSKAHSDTTLLSTNSPPLSSGGDNEEGFQEESNKLESSLLMLKNTKHRVLIFCQFKMMVDYVERLVIKKYFPNIRYYRIDGGVAPLKRTEIVNLFNDDPSIDLLLLTTSVGGQGLTLTGADTVIFVECDWNPTKDLQAMDRAHRLGQKKTVNVYRFITKETIEEKLMSLQKFKLSLAGAIITQQNMGLDKMKTVEVVEMLSLSENSLESSHKSKPKYDDGDNNN